MARVEAFIAGWGLDEALKRSEAYLNAGADAILMHSKKADPSDIESFVKAWNNQVSIVLFSWNKVGLKKKKADSGLLIMASSCSPITELERAQQQQQSQAVESTQILIYVQVPLRGCTCSHDLLIFFLFFAKFSNNKISCSLK